MQIFRHLLLGALLSAVAYVIYCLLNIAQTHPVHQSLWDANTEKVFLSNFLTKPLPTNNRVFNEDTATFNYGRYHHRLSIDDKMDFSFPPSVFYSKQRGGGGVIQKYMLLKEWSWTAVVTEDHEWFCGTALSNIQTGSGFFLYCYNNNDGRMFHKTIENLETHLFGFGWGTKFKSPSDPNRQQAYANNGCLVWEDGELNNKFVASGSHCFNDTTGFYDIKVKMHSASEKTIDGKEIGVPVSMELDYSFQIASTSSSSNVVDEGMSHVFPLGPNNNNRAGMSTKYSAVKAKLHKLKIERKVTFERSYAEDSEERKRHEKEKVIVNIEQDEKSGGGAIALLDWTRSQFPRRTRWIWVAFAANLKSKKVLGEEKNEKGETISLQLEKDKAENAKKSSSEKTTMTRLGMQLTALSYLTPSNYSVESVIWIDGTAYLVDSPVVFENLEPLQNSWSIGGSSYKVFFDMTKQDSSSSPFIKNDKKDFFRLSMTFTKRAVHIQDFSLYKPVTDGALHHQIGEYTNGVLSHFVRSDSIFKLKHVYRFENIPGVLEDHDTWW